MILWDIFPVWWWGFFLEAINGTLLVIFGGLGLVFGHYIASWMREVGVVQGYRDRRGAIAIALLLGGDAVIRASVWAWRHFGLPVDLTLLTVASTVGVGLCIMGCTCGLRHFSPRRWGVLPWIGIPLAGLAFGVGAATLKLWGLA